MIIEGKAKAELGSLETEDLQKVVLDQSFLPSNMRVRRARPAAKPRAVSQIPHRVVEIHSKKEPSRAPAPAAAPDAESNFSDFLSEVKEFL